MIRTDIKSDAAKSERGSVLSDSGQMCYAMFVGNEPNAPIFIDQSIRSGPFVGSKCAYLLYLFRILDY